MKKLAILSVVIVALAGLSCHKENTDIPAEPIKSVNGSWKIVKALRNGTDLTTRFDFSAFRIRFTDSLYTIENQVPFIVSKNGKWSFDDPFYPFRIAFRADGDTTKMTDVQYPVVSGVRNIVISFSPGCKLNTYQYTLQKVD